ncbi:MAG: toxin-antitoxin system YwqK family antitoxin [Bacteroidales bacterium]
MKKICLLLMAISLAFVSFSQTTKIVNGDTINKTDLKNLKQGYWEETNNKFLLKGNYLNDKKDGIWVTYNFKELATKIESFRNGEKDGIIINIDDNGYYKGEANYRNDLLNGVSRTYAVGGKLLSDINYKNGVLNGSKKTYYKSNNIMQEEANYLNGQRDGITKWYDTNGKLIAEYSYKNGKFEGVNKTYSANGDVLVEETYVNNIQNGPYKEYFDIEPVVSQNTFSKDTDKKENVVNKEDVSLKTTTVKLKVSGNYLNGKKDGKWLEYDDKGAVIKTIVYKDGVEKK